MRYKNKDKNMESGTESEFLELIRNEKEANRYVAKGLRVCSVIGIIAWVLNILDIFIVPNEIMNLAMPIVIAFFMLPTLICKITGG